MQSATLASIVLLVAALPLWGGAELLVRGAATLARNLGIRPVVVGMTVVAFATSFPELLVCLVAALGLSGADAETLDQALGNIVGSNVANILLILGVSCLITPIRLATHSIRLEVALLLVASLALALVVWFHQLDRVVAIAFLFGLLLVIVNNVMTAKDRSGEFTQEFQMGNTWRAVLEVVVGGGLVYLGATLMVSAAGNLAITLGLAQGMVGYTILAIGTSLPELVTCVVAGTKGEADLSIGNIVGSNLFNILLIGGTVGMVRTLPPTDALQLWGIPWMLAATLLLIYVGRRGEVLGRQLGSLLVLLFIISTAGIQLWS